MANELPSEDLKLKIDLGSCDYIAFEVDKDNELEILADDDNITRVWLNRAQGEQLLALLKRWLT